jgi:hypothetical protein
MESKMFKLSLLGAPLLALAATGAFAVETKPSGAAAGAARRQGVMTATNELAAGIVSVIALVFGALAGWFGGWSSPIPDRETPFGRLSRRAALGQR